MILTNFIRRSRSASSEELISGPILSQWRSIRCRNKVMGNIGGQDVGVSGNMDIGVIEYFIAGPQRQHMAAIWIRLSQHQNNRRNVKCEIGNWQD